MKKICQALCKLYYYLGVREQERTYLIQKSSNSDTIEDQLEMEYLRGYITGLDYAIETLKEETK